MKNKETTILVVDDEIEVLRTLKDILESKGWQVFTVPTATSCLAILEKEKIDIVLLDIRLPDKSGIEVLKEIKQKYPNIAVVMVTGFSYDDELVNESIRLGAAGYVSKSVPLKELIEAINNVLTK